MQRLVPFAAFALVLGLAGPLRAGTLTSPVLFEGVDQNVCVAINVGTKPLEVTVEIVPVIGSPDPETCTLQPGDPNGCQAFVNGAGFCRVTAAGSDAKLRKTVRAVMMNRQVATPNEIYTAVEAR
jgi:hypothetical protein